MNMLLSRWRYYLSSIPTLLMGVGNWPSILSALLNRARREPFVVQLRPRGNRFKARSLMDVWIIKETCLDRDYEQEGVTVPQGGVILDIGAGLGDFTIHAARAYPSATVYAFEPFPESFALLQENIRLNGLTNIKSFPYAIGGERTERRTLYTGAAAAVQYSTLPVESSPSSTANTVDVTSITLDRFFAEQGVPHCDLLKIDCEGAEYEIFFNTSDQTLAKIKQVSMEYHDGVVPHSHQELVTFFRDKGFQVVVRPNPAHAHLGLLYARQ